MIYIQSNKDRTLAHHFDCACALYGAIDSNLDFRLTTFSEIESGKFDSLIERNLFVGSVEFMKLVFNRIGLNDIRLPKNSNRESTIISICDALDYVKSYKRLFIKPIDIKLFSGFILDSMQYSCLKDIDPNTKIIAYEPFKHKILSEWRTYIYKNNIIDSRNYSGDFKINPDYEYIENVIKENTNFPISYTIDIGILENKENVVIEFNDMWAIGNYGIPNDMYLKLLKDRYFEIISK